MKKYIFGIIIGGIIFGTGVFAATTYLYSSDEVSYTPSDNEWNVNNVESALDSLRTQSGNALTNLKNTNIAKAVNANGDTLSSVISTLGNITNRGNKTFSITNTSAVTIPAGYYDGTGKIQTSGMMVTPTQTLTLSDVTSGTDVTNYKTVKTSGLVKPTGTRYISSNGTYTITDYKYVDISVPVDKATWTVTNVGNTVGTNKRTLVNGGTYIICLSCTGSQNTVNTNFTFTGGEVLAKTSNGAVSFDGHHAHSVSLIIKMTSDTFTVTGGYGGSYADLLIAVMRIS